MLVAWRHTVAWVWWTKWRWVSVPGWMLVGMRSLQIWCSCYPEVSGDSWGLRAGWHLVRYPSLSLLPSWLARTPQSPTFSVWFGTVSGTASSKLIPLRARYSLHRKGRGLGDVVVHSEGTKVEAPFVFPVGAFTPPRHSMTEVFACQVEVLDGSTVAIDVNVSLFSSL